MNQKINEKIKVLIADDEVEFASTLSTRLQLRGYTTIIANSGEETLDAISQQEPDVVLLDLKERTKPPTLNALGGKFALLSNAAIWSCIFSTIPGT